MWLFSYKLRINASHWQREIFVRVILQVVLLVTGLFLSIPCPSWFVFQSLLKDMHRLLYYCFSPPSFESFKRALGNHGNSPVRHPCLCFHGSEYTFRPTESKCNSDHADFVARVGLNPWSALVKRDSVSMHRTADRSRTPFPSLWEHNASPTNPPPP